MLGAVPKKKGLIFAEERQEVSLQFPKLSIGIIKIVVKKKKLFQKKNRQRLFSKVATIKVKTAIALQVGGIEVSLVWLY